ncbi:hypothetical protein F8O01_06135 [Pseudoclavibacter chungangensis]|uniref:GerMN domain-containing protein n=1 Tax=Pseudoclavibacter chungangensis TaxID=587635 RepID=A0A7J5BYT8_9MICO|nr:LpqB family beta-propeller domain-containing protein [Pseudoclavibacter chungangensis]KAB1659502.1 hypothetical protein F8O01_06135 [Pseudoclavibacter chungangensis]NYJ67639.1 hypothetical protein [Pseudoclavibacter chungangensis]
MNGGTTRVGRGVRALTALALCVLVLVGCARLPLSGPVMEGDPIEGVEEPGVRFLPAGPIAGATPEQIASGFLEAGTGTSSDYQTARSFLTSDYAASWNPTLRVLVVRSEPVFEFDGVSRVTATLDVVAVVGPDAVYRDLPSPETRTIDLDVQSVDGEWRIGDAEDGLVLLEQQFSDVFEPYTLNFFDRGMRDLVPDVRWFPDYTNAPTRIVDALLGGPAGWLREGSVVSAFPADAIRNGPVVTDQGIATVNFTTSFSAAPYERFPYMLLQLQQSLVGVGKIEEVEIAVNGKKLDIEALTSDQVNTDYPVSSTPLVYQDGVLGYLSGGNSVTQVEGAEKLASVLPNLEPSRGVLATDEGLGAFLTADGVVAIPFDTGQPVPLHGRFDSVVPSIDRHGYVWTAATTGPAVMAQNVTERTEQELQVPGLAGGGTVAIEVSRDGARVAMLVRDAGVVSLAIMAIERDDVGAPIGLGTPEVVAVGVGTAIDLTWVDRTDVAILVEDGRGASTVRVHQIGGGTDDFGAIENGVQIVGSNTLVGLRTVDNQGNLFVPKSNRWQSTGAKVSFLVTQA